MIQAKDVYTERAYLVEVQSLLDILGIEYSEYASVRVKNFDNPTHDVMQVTPVDGSRVHRIQVTVREPAARN